jgi:hypothetical protein
MTYGAAGVAAAAVLVLSINLLPHVSRSAPIAEVPRAEAAEPKAPLVAPVGKPAEAPAVDQAPVVAKAPAVQDPAVEEAPAARAPAAAPRAVETHVAEVPAAEAPHASEAKSEATSPPKKDAPPVDENAAANTEHETPAPAASVAAAEPTIAESADEAPEFDKAAALSALDDAVAGLPACNQPSAGPGTTRVAISFAPTGRVTTAILENPGPFAGTPVAGCIVTRLRGMHIPKFSGETVTLHRTVTLP